MSELFDRLESEYAAAKTLREQLVEARWKRNVEYVMPKLGEYGFQPTWEDSRYDSTATDASAQVADGMFGNISPAHQRWFRYRFLDEELNEGNESQELLDRLTDHMEGVFRRSTYYSVGPEWMQTCSVIGTVSMDIQEDVETGRIVCRVENPRANYLTIDQFGQVNRMFCRVPLNAEQAAQKFGEDVLEPFIQRELKQMSWKEHEYIQVIEPRRRRNRRARNARNMPFASYWFRPGDARREILQEGGYLSFAKPTWRWSTTGTNPYGWGPTDDAWPDIKTLNDMIMSGRKAAHRGSDPPVWLPKEGRGWSLNPGSRMYGRDPNRRPQPVDMTGGFILDYNLLELLIEQVKARYKVRHFLMLMADTDGEMTAREVVERKKEQSAVTGSSIGKLETEGLDGIHHRMLQIEHAAGRLDFLPPGLLGAQLKVEYLGPLSMLAREVAAQENILGALEAAFPFFQLWSQTLDLIKAPEAARKTLNSKGFPAELVHTEREYADIQEEKRRRMEKAERQALEMEMLRGMKPEQKPEPGSPADALARSGLNGRL